MGLLTRAVLILDSFLSRGVRERALLRSIRSQVSLGRSHSLQAWMKSRAVFQIHPALLLVCEISVGAAVQLESGRDRCLHVGARPVLRIRLMVPRATVMDLVEMAKQRMLH